MLNLSRLDSTTPDPCARRRPAGPGAVGPSAASSLAGRRSNGARQRRFGERLQALAAIVVCSSTPAVATAQQAPFTDLSQGSSHTCAVDEAGAVVCDVPFFLERIEQPDDLPPMSRVAAGQVHTCGIDTGGRLVCWGDGDFGQLVAPTSASPFVRIAAGLIHSCAVDAAGAAFCWGEPSGGKTRVPGGVGPFADVDAGATHSCGLLTSGGIACWGRNDAGQLDVPVEPAGFKDVAVGARASCGLTEDGRIRCWGDVTEVPDGGPFDAIDVGGFTRARTRVCGVVSSGAVALECVYDSGSEGYRGYLALRESIRGGARTPLAVSLAVSSDPGCVRFDDGSVDCFGRRAIDASAITGEGLEPPPAPVISRIARYSGTTVELVYGSRAQPAKRGEGFEIVRNGELLTVTRNASNYVDDTLVPGVDYAYTIAFLRADGVRSEPSAPVVVNTGSSGGGGGSDGGGGGGDGDLDALPERTLEVENLEARVYSDTTLELLWTRPATRFRAFEVRRDGEFLGFTRGTSFLDRGVSPGRRYRYDVIGIALDGRIDGVSSISRIVGSDEVCYAAD